MDSLFNLTDNGVTVSKFNSIAYNPVDGFIYGINQESPYQLYRINNLGEVQYLGDITGMSGTNQAGAMGSNGEYYITGGSQILYQIDINTLTATEIGYTGVGTADIGVSPTDGQLYCWSRDNQLVSIDPGDATSVLVGSPNTNFRVFGALYFNEQGEIIAYGDDVNVGIALNQETLVKIDPATGVVTVLGTGPATGYNDGCSCAYSIEMTKAAAPTTVNAGDVFTYTFTVFNRTGGALSNITFNDVLTDGFLWNTEPENETGLTLGTTSIIGTATANFTISTAQVGESSFTIDVLAPSDFCDD
ncbi:MAG: DUF11 domain-containing protein, partial [Bacteroidetes bacterium]|nr:DUF11 domain-containing protein [Bacteroidota bacterium]